MANQIQRNIFHKGIATDLDYSKRTNDVWDFPTLNVRILNKKGQGMIITNLPGNTLELEVTDGFTIIGCCEARGRLIIASCKDDGTGTGELGMFPSFNSSTGLWERVYRPLCNYTGVLPAIPANVDTGPVTTTPFRSTKFNWDIRHQQRMVSKVSYDDTDDIYFCDYKNNNRVINTGIDKKGNLRKNRIYCEDDFGSKINQILTTNKALIVGIIDDINDVNYYIRPTGKLLHGNYFLFFRYVTYNYLKTQIVQEFGPCQVYSKGDTITATTGGAFDKESGNRILVYLGNLDPTYSYIELSYVRYYSDESGVQMKEIKTVSKYYEIKKDANGVPLPWQPIMLNGYEQMIDTPESDILAQMTNDKICKDQTIMDNRWWGANWKEINHNYEELIEFSQKVKLYSFTSELPAKPWQECNGTSKNFELSKTEGQYKHELNTLEYVGYFRTEAYPFGIQYEFNDGSLSDIFPTLGYDCLGLDSAGTDHANADVNYDLFPNKVNNKGIYRFPRPRKEPFYDNVQGQELVFPMGIKFDFTDAIAWYNTLPDDSLMKTSIRGIRLVRGERIPNLLYQGIMFGCARPFGNTPSARLTFDCSLRVDGRLRHVANYYANKNNDGDWGQGGVDFSSDTIDYSVKGNEIGPYRYGQMSFDLKQATDLVGTNSGNGRFWRAKEKGDINGLHEYKNAHIPIWRGYAPMHYWKKNENENKKIVNVCYTSRWFIEPGSYAFYSPDFLLRRINDVDSVSYLMRVAKTRAPGIEPVYHFNDYWYDDQSQCGGSPEWPGLNESDLWISPPITLAEMAGGLNYNAIDKDRNMWLKGKAAKVGESVVANFEAMSAINNMFVNYSSDDHTNPANCLYSAQQSGSLFHRAKNWTVRSMYAAKYIGINSWIDDYENPVGNNGGSNNFLYDIVNLYKNDPIAINPVDVYEVESLHYFYIDNKLYSFDYLKGDEDEYGEIKITEFSDGSGSDEDSGSETSDSGSIIDIPKKTGSPIIGVYRGDCFIQRFYFKQMYWDGSQFGSSSHHEGYDTIGFDSGIGDNPDGYGSAGEPTFKGSFGHGLVFGIVVESAINSAMRHPGEITSYYPLENNKTKFAKAAYNQGGIESLLMNMGYNRTLSNRMFLHYDKNRPVDNEDYIDHITRVRHSSKHDDNSFVDNFRNIDVANYVDFPINDGAIFAIRNILSTLITIQERSINRHYTENDKTIIPSSTGELSVSAGAILSSQYQKLADYGTSHLWSVVEANESIYGVDYLRRLIFEVASRTNTNTGQSTISARSIEEDIVIEKWIYELFDAWEKRTDIINSFEDTPVAGIGISSGYDKKYNEVHFTFINRNKKSSAIVTEERPWRPLYFYYLYELITIDGDVYYCNQEHVSGSEINMSYWTLVDVDNLNIFVPDVKPTVGSIYCCCRREGETCYLAIYTGLPNQELSYCWAMYDNHWRGSADEDRYIYNALEAQCIITYDDKSKTLIYNDKIKGYVGEASYTPPIYANIVEDFFSVNNGNEMYLHNQEANYCMYYGVQYPWELSFVVNGISEEEDSSMVAMNKVFEALEIEANHVAYHSITYETEFQTSVHTPFSESDTRFWMSPEYLEHKWRIPIFVQSSANEDAFYTESEMRGTWMKITLKGLTHLPIFVKDCITLYRISKT